MHGHNYAEATGWGALIPGGHVGEFMSIYTRWRRQYGYEAVRLQQKAGLLQWQAKSLAFLDRLSSLKIQGSSVGLVEGGECTTRERPNHSSFNAILAS